VVCGRVRACGEYRSGDGEVSKLLEDLIPEALFKAVHGINMLQNRGIPFVVTSTKRTADEQYALWLQGRGELEMVNEARRVAGMRPINASENDYTVTKCDGVTFKSRHQGGRALDVVPADARGNPVWPPASDSRWGQIAEVMKLNGFAWGGEWTVFPDLPHYEIA